MGSGSEQIVLNIRNKKAKKLIRKYPLFLASRDIQIQTTLDFILPQSKCLSSTQPLTTNAGKVAARGALVHC